MKASVVTSFDRPLEIVDRPTPSQAPDRCWFESGPTVCATDIHAAHGDWPITPTLPFVPGHEGVGIVEQTAPGVVEVGPGRHLMAGLCLRFL